MQHSYDVQLNVRRSYIDLSVRKLLPIFVITAMLFVAVGITFTAKNERYGTTPFYASVALGLQEASSYPLYAFELGFERLIASMRALFGADARITSNDPHNASGIPVLAYHRLVSEPDGQNVTVANFKGQMEALKREEWQTITLEQFEEFMRGERDLPAKSVLITFDDGAKQSYYAVDPILKAHGFSAVNYIILNASRLDESTYYLSEQEIRRMLDTGRWEIGSHSSVGHQPYAIDARGREGHFFSDLLWRAEDGRNETPGEFRSRIAEDFVYSKNELERTFGQPIRTFAFPFGDAGEFSINFPESADIAIDEASKVYDFGFVQVGRNDFSYNHAGEGFLAHRIHVDHDWDGARLLHAMNRGFQKPLPYEDPLADDRGWIPSWEEFTIDNGALELAASASSSGAAAFLDGTRHWKNYEWTADVDWRGGHAMLLGAMHDSDTHYTCSFSYGDVDLVRVDGDTRTALGNTDDDRIVRGSVTLGMRVQGDVIQCLYNGDVLLSVRELDGTQGGIGFQVWHESLGAASMTVRSIAARDVSNERAVHPQPRVVPAAQTPRLTPAVPDTGSTPPEEQSFEPTAPVSTPFPPTESPPAIEETLPVERETRDNERAEDESDDVRLFWQHVEATLKRFTEKKGTGEEKEQKDGDGKKDRRRGDD